METAATGKASSSADIGQITMDDDHSVKQVVDDEMTVGNIAIGPSSLSIGKTAGSDRMYILYNLP